MIKSTDNIHEPTLVFITDLPSGGCLVECPHCKAEFDTLNVQESLCPSCGKEVLYPSYAEW